MNILKFWSVIIFGTSCVMAVEVEEFWYRAQADELQNLRILLDTTNSVDVNLLWRDKAGELWERRL